jgi:dihydroorotate dehydrogenase electron transfer subunit
MENRRKQRVRVESQTCIAKDIYSMWIVAPEVASMAVPGQFISVYTKDGSKLLPRPISLCEVDAEGGRIRIVYRVTGKAAGTAQFAAWQAGEEIEILGPLGNGFSLDVAKGKRAMLIGGGIGVPPMLELAKRLDATCDLVMGYRDETFLLEEFESQGTCYVATEDGSCGCKGTVLDAIQGANLTADVVFACGPTPMLRAIKHYCLEREIPCYLSMEEKMACGIGACLACVCKSKEIDSHSQVNNKRVCKDGPVFLSTEVEL